MMKAGDLIHKTKQKKKSELVKWQPRGLRDTQFWIVTCSSIPTIVSFQGDSSQEVPKAGLLHDEVLWSWYWFSPSASGLVARRKSHRSSELQYLQSGPPLINLSFALMSASLLTRIHHFILINFSINIMYLLVTKHLSDTRDILQGRSLDGMIEMLKVWKLKNKCKKAFCFDYLVLWCCNIVYSKHQQLKQKSVSQIVISLLND